MIEELLLILGPGLLTRFLATFAGTSVTFPKTPSTPFFAELVRVVGLEAAERLRTRFAGEYLYIPRNDADERARRDVEIAARLAAGESPAAIARSYMVVSRLSERHVRRIAAGVSKSDGGVKRVKES